MNFLSFKYVPKGLLRLHGNIILKLLRNVHTFVRNGFKYTIATHHRSRIIPIHTYTHTIQMQNL